MDSRNNVIAMMVLGAGIVALGGSILSGEIFKGEKPEKPGYIVEGVEAEAGAGPVVAEVPIATLLAAADPAKGAEVFKKCASCHSIANGGANGIGPNLWATLGEEIGKGKGGYAFSEVLSGKGGKWDFESMNQWLKNPKAFAPGTKMSFAGLSKGEDRANVLAYLNSQGSNLPLPAAPAAVAAPSPGAAAAPADKPKG
jgi:cytochrome c